MHCNQLHLQDPLVHCNQLHLQDPLVHCNQLHLQVPLVHCNQLHLMSYPWLTVACSLAQLKELGPMKIKQILVGFSGELFSMFLCWSNTNFNNENPPIKILNRFNKPNYVENRLQLKGSVREKWKGV